MSNDNNTLKEIINLRYSQVKELKDSKINPYPARCKRTHGCAEAKEQDENKEVACSGRVVQLRLMGKAAFMHVKDMSGKVQSYVARDLIGEDKYTFFKKNIAVGDFVELSGKMFITKTGEKTIKADAVNLISKAIRPMPEKFHGIADTEVRFRNRHLDLIANENVAEIFKTRAKIISAIRKVLDAKGFLEVETPTLTPDAGGAAARPFETFHNSLKMPLFMRIALELYHKKLVVGGLEKIYEIGKMFRNEGIDTTHNPEFTMIELYQAYSDFDGMAKLFEDIVAGCVKETGIAEVDYKGKKINLKPPFKRISIPKVWKEKFGQDIHEILEGSGFHKENIFKLADKIGMKFEKDTAPAKVFDKIFDDKLLPDYTDPIFMIDYPVAVSPFSKCREDDPQITERFEVFINSEELANAYSEINDPNDQLERLQDQLADKGVNKSEDSDIVDNSYIEALESGMPPTGGMGIGIDRLVMIFTGHPSIREVILFPILKTEEKEK